MTIEQAVEKALKDSTDLAAKVYERIYYAQAPPETQPPYVVHHGVSSPAVPQVPFYRPRWQFSCWAKRLDEAREIARIVRDLFIRYRGIMGGAGGVAVRQGAYIDSIPYQDPQVGWWNAPVELYFIHREGL